MIPEEEAAAMLKLTPRTLRVYCTNAKKKKYNIRTARVSGKMIYYCKQDIQQEINNRVKIH
jgi:hypothetical protein